MIISADGEQESSIFTAPTTSTRGTKTAPVQSRTELQKVMNETPAKKQNSAEIVEKRAVVRKCLPPIEDSPVATSCTPGKIFKKKSSINETHAKGYTKKTENSWVMCILSIDP